MEHPEVNSGGHVHFFRQAWLFVCDDDRLQPHLDTIHGLRPMYPDCSTCSFRCPRVVSKPSPIQSAKGVKNAAELEGMRAAHVRDGVAMVLALSRLERDVAEGLTISEVEVDHRITASRAEQDKFLGRYPLPKAANGLFQCRMTSWRWKYKCFMNRHVNIRLHFVMQLELKYMSLHCRFNYDPNSRRGPLQFAN